ncbi:membrane fusion protein, cobalt-zinc-cadmium efflux system [Nitrosomonas cryotolerans]|uniref:Membrane fusion protein, cobalt-zinc-cadmium efflux system n=1 Tax=Nitrosomonas cryotolerans ATCC 49181 TaxID=1131553 RepID=A0A1N6I2Y2_9PROT|nr:efflux RND transporter periplasmic adaptor subunit [Nitrosomonas cryotolerans]SFP59125.1 membrane fusion protein, cobalt-zinc-cadmium efflux system [Nitrosomonas cryotolerans]SIO26370.1 membrane fusion protein, cobalt-zinc-cadmium efflux system [Nitrosomonas cryotolerans ATCC 49181]
MDKTNLKPIIIVIVMGVIVGALILSWDKTVSRDDDAGSVSVDDRNSEEKKGPKGGKLFTTDNFSVEVTIYEKGVPPQFRLYLYENDKPLPPTAAQAAITLSRLGAPAQLVKFKAEGNYLLGDQVVVEPHSFDAAIAVEWMGKTFHWGYSQIEARIEMSDETLESSGVEIETAGPAILRPKLQLPGVVTFNHHNIVRVVPRVPGIVVNVERHLGGQVEKGEVLAVIESQVLAELRSQYLAAQKRLDLARITFEREQQLWKEKITAKQDYLTAQQLSSEAEIALELASAKLRAFGEQPEKLNQVKNLTRFEIRAPISGLVITKEIARGEVLKEDKEIFTLADVSTMYAALTVYPKDLNVIKIGQTAIIKAVASDVKGEGVVSYISAFIDEQTRTAQARITLDNKERQWRAGMFINIALIAEEIEVPVAVSMDALQTLHDWTVVFGRYGEYFEARPLELGRSDGEQVEVLEGLSAGEKYAGGNSFAIKAELGKSGATHDH